LATVSTRMRCKYGATGVNKMSYSVISYDELHARASNENLRAYPIKISHKDSGFYQVQVTSEGTLCLKSGDDGKRWELSPKALEQLCKDAEFPTSYAHVCPIDLLQRYLAWRYTQEVYRYQIIVDENDRVIMLAPHTFTFIPTYQILETVDEALRRNPLTFTPTVVRADDYSSMVYYTTEDIVWHSRRGGLIYGSWVLQTSPMGELIARICPGTLQVVCKNGMIMCRHEKLRETMRHAERDRAATLRVITEVIPRYNHILEATINRLRHWETIPVRSLEFALRILRGHYYVHIHNDDIKTILEYLNRISYSNRVSPIENMFDVMATVSYAVQRAGFDLETTARLEEFAGNLVRFDKPILLSWGQRS
jgi:hypothetical protein